MENHLSGKIPRGRQEVTTMTEHEGKPTKESSTSISAPIGGFTMEHLRTYLYGHKKVQLIDTTKLEKERIKHLHINKEPKGNSWCDICNESPEECPMHGPLHSLRKLVNQSHMDTPVDYSQILKFPDEVGLCTSSIPGIEYGVCAKAAIPSGTWIGPYEGRLVRPEQIKSSTETEFMWEIFHDGQVSHYLDARDESNSSWMRFIRCARQRFEQNMVIFQYHGCIYYRTTKDVKVGEELLVWYDSRYSQIFGIPVSLNESGNRGVNPPKGIVTQERTYGKRRIQPEAQRPKRMSREAEGPTVIKQEHCEDRLVHTPVQHNAPISTSQTAFNYRNSMYHRGRWYTIANDDQTKRVASETMMDRKEHCNKCLNSFGTRASFLGHSCVKEACRSYTCAYCDLACGTLTELGKHMEDHVNERPYRCGFCSCSFNNGAALNQHVRIHAREYPQKQIAMNHGIDKSRV